LPTIKLLCYADNTLVFLWDAVDRDRTVLYLRLYIAASNAHINFHKFQAMSLSGKGHDDYWLPRLTALDIKKVWNSHDPDPVIYLGYPLFAECDPANHLL
ncbi:hypothetical protein BD408DRAFT_356959, partial [Parasitella parasitica]